MKARTPRDPHGVRDEWLTVDEVCTELKISRRTFDRWRALGTGPDASVSQATERSASGAAGSSSGWTLPTRTSLDHLV